MTDSFSRELVYTNQENYQKYSKNLTENIPNGQNKIDNQIIPEHQSRKNSISNLSGDNLELLGKKRKNLSDSTLENNTSSLNANSNSLNQGYIYNSFSEDNYYNLEIGRSINNPTNHNAEIPRAQSNTCEIYLLYFY